MVTNRLVIGSTFTLVLALAQTLRADPPTIPPTVSYIWPAGMERGTTATFTIGGRNLSGATAIYFDGAGISGRVVEITDEAEQITGPRAGEDLGAQVPLGKKQTAKLEITVAKDASPGIHRFRIKTPLGTTNTMVLAVGMLPEIKRREAAMGSEATPQMVGLPATLIGAISTRGEKDTYEFEGKANEEVVFRVQAASLGSKLTSTLVLSDSSGQVLTASSPNAKSPDAEMSYKLPRDGRYVLTIGDRDMDAGMDHFYRLDAGELPFVTSHFPLGLREGEAAKISVEGVNLNGAHEIRVESPSSAKDSGSMLLGSIEGGVSPINEVRLAVGKEPETTELEPNDTPAQAQLVSLPVTINGHIDGGSLRGKKADEDYFRFHATKGEHLSIDVEAARLGSSLDSVIEVLDSQGNAIPRATIRCLNQTTTTLSDRDSMTTGIRLVSTSELHEGDYLMVGDELNQIDFVPDQPDADTILKGIGYFRTSLLGTSPDVHAVDTPVYKAQILPPDAEFPSNGLPVFHLTWRNDDGGPGYGADSTLDFVAPADGDYLVHLADVRGMEGPDAAYRLTIRPWAADFRLTADPANPNIPRGGSTLVTVSNEALRSLDSPIEINVEGLPAGVTARSATIPVRQRSTILVLTASADAAVDSSPAAIRIVGHAVVEGHDLVRTANPGQMQEQSLQLASITPGPDVVVTTETSEVSLEPGREATVTLHIDRHNGFKGRVPCDVLNLPPGVRVVNVGLNGVLVTEAQSSRTFTLRAEDWAKPITQPIYVVANVESNSPTLHPSPPLLLKVTANKQTAEGRSGNQE